MGYFQFLLFCLLVFVLHIEVSLCWMHIYNCFVWYADSYSSCLFISFCMEYIFYPLTFSLYVSLGLKWVFCRQHIYVYLFLIHSALILVSFLKALGYTQKQSQIKKQNSLFIPEYVRIYPDGQYYYHIGKTAYYTMTWLFLKVEKSSPQWEEYLLIW